VIAAAPPSFANSDNAGCYLCNYVYYRALRRFPAKRVGFVHVPPLDVMPLDAQRERLAHLLSALEFA
jgi:pyrrolidone-carboxylate peptidase